MLAGGAGVNGAARAGSGGTGGAESEEQSNRIKSAFVKQLIQEHFRQSMQAMAKKIVV